MQAIDTNAYPIINMSCTVYCTATDVVNVGVAGIDGDSSIALWELNGAMFQACLIREC